MHTSLSEPTDLPTSTDGGGRRGWVLQMSSSSPADTFTIISHLLDQIRREPPTSQISQVGLSRQPLPTINDRRLK
ncbi:hypothetical protein COP2_008339 [Malus domestica]